MEQINKVQSRVKELEVMAGLKLIETEYKVKVPVFEDVQVKVPKFVEEPIKVPVGFDQVVNALALELAEKVTNKVEELLDKRLKLAIDERIKEIKAPKIVEELVIKPKEVEVEKPFYTTVEISRPVYVDKTIINPVLKDVEVVNAKIVDKIVENAVVTDVHLTNAIIKDVEVERAVIREKVIDVIHPRYLDLKGNSIK